MPKTIVCVSCRGIIGDDLPEDEQFAQEEEFMNGMHICQKCARKERVQKLIRKYERFMKDFAHLVNNTVYDHDGITTEALVNCFFREHRYLQNEMILGVRKILSKIGEQSGNSMYEDARNQWGLKWCNEMSKLEVTL